MRSDKKEIFLSCSGWVITGFKQALRAKRGGVEALSTVKNIFIVALSRQSFIETGGPGGNQSGLECQLSFCGIA